MIACWYLYRHVKDADKAIIAHIKGLGRLVESASLMHSYPFCWRSDTPLIYKVQETQHYEAVTEATEACLLDVSSHLPFCTLLRLCGKLLFLTAYPRQVP